MTSARLGSVCALSLLAALVGCDGDDTNPARPDAGGGGKDASIATSLEDAAPSSVDGSGDGSDDDAATGDAGPAVTVVAVDLNGSAEPGVAVVFSDSAGTVLGGGVTDATGTASGIVPAGGQVTVLFGTAAAPTLVTTFGVEPGDTLHATDVSGSQAGFVESISVTALPASPDDAGASFQLNAGTCGASGTATPLAFQLYASPPPCVVGGQFPLLVVDQAADGTPLAFAFQKSNAALVDGGALALSMAGATWATPTQETLVLSNVPPGFEAPAYVFTEVAGGVPATASPLATAPDDGGVAFSVHPGYADFVQTEANVQLGTAASDAGPGVLFAAIAARSAAAPATPLAFDLTQTPPFIAQAALDATNPKRPSASWTGATPLGGADGILVVVAWGAGTWTFVVPPGQTSARAPILPASASAWPPGPEAAFGPVIVTVVQASFWSGYAEMRAGSAGLVSEPLIDVNGCLGTNRACLPPLPADGTLAITAYSGE